MTDRDISDGLILESLWTLIADAELAAFVADLSDKSKSTDSLVAPLRPPPSTFHEAMQGPDADKWMEAMLLELKQQADKGTDRLVPRDSLPKGTQVLNCGWRLTYKLDWQGRILKYKARDYAKGCAQKPGTYGDTFAACARIASYKLLLALCAAKGWPFMILDVTLAFLNALLKNPVYLRQAYGFETRGPNGEELVRETLVSKYGLKQSGNLWIEDKDASLVVEQWTPTVADGQVFTYKYESGPLAVSAWHVDDSLIIAR